MSVVFTVWMTIAVVIGAYGNRIRVYEPEDDLFNKDHNAVRKAIVRMEKQK